MLIIVFLFLFKPQRTVIYTREDESPSVMQRSDTRNFKNKMRINTFVMEEDMVSRMK